MKFGVVSHESLNWLEDLMKTIVIFISVVVISIFTSCSGVSDPANTDAQVTKPSNTIITTSSPAQIEYQTILPVSDEDFELLAKFIETKGFSVDRGRTKGADHQYTFFDSNKNRHALIAIRRDENSKPSSSSPVTQISVWAYKSGIRDQNHFYGYNIVKGKGVMSYLPKGMEHNADLIAFGVREFLTKVKKT